MEDTIQYERGGGGKSWMRFASTTQHTTVEEEEERLAEKRLRRYVGGCQETKDFNWEEEEEYTPEKPMRRSWWLPEYSTKHTVHTCSGCNA